MTPQQAKEICIEAHKGQFRRDGVTPYSTHPIGVARLLLTPNERLVAFLHDVIEDCEGYYLEELDSKFRLITPDTFYSLTREQYEALSLLTKKKGQSYTDYINNICNSVLAIKVKLADITYNLADNPSIHQTNKYLKHVPVLLKALR